jgi:uncharacterized membrane protein YhaH (DUF805 family)
MTSWHAQAETVPTTTVGHRPWLRFLGHFGEMFVVMMIGMPLFGMPEQAIVRAMGYPHPTQQFPVIAAFLMTINMTVPMVALMRYRGHSWARSGEMAAAMVVPSVAIIVLCVVGMIPTRSVSGLVMLLMLPAMLVVMLYRRTEYAHGGAHRHASAAGH